MSTSLKSALCAGVATFVMSWGQPQAWAASNAWAEVSDVAQYVPLVWGGGVIFHGGDYEGALQMTTAGALTLGSSELLKRKIDKKRPNFEPGDNKNSFPSGHVAKAWFATAYVQRRYGCYEFEWNCWRGAVIPYTAAVVTAVGRLHADRHHWEDVVASAVIAEAFVWLTTDKHDGEMLITPAFDDGLGIALFIPFW